MMSMPPACVIAAAQCAGAACRLAAATARADGYIVAAATLITAAEAADAAAASLGGAIKPRRSRRANAAKHQRSVDVQSDSDGTTALPSSALSTPPRSSTDVGLVDRHGEAQCSVGDAVRTFDLTANDVVDDEN